MVSLGTWPFPAGESPFRIKGLGYSFHMDYVRDVLPGGVDAHNAALSPEIRKFFEQTFFATSWYDVYPLIVAGRACGEVSGLGFERFVRARAKHQVERDLGLVRTALVRVLTSASLARRVPQFNASYFDFVTVQSSKVDDCAVEGSCEGIPAPFVDWYCWASETFICEILARGGAKDVNVAWAPATEASETSAAEQSVPRTRTDYRITWS